MKRYALCDIVGDGNADLPEEEWTDATGPFRAYVHGRVANYVAVIPSQADGRPRHAHCLVLIADRSLARFGKDVRIDLLPDFPLSAKVSSIATVERATMDAALKRRGISAAAVGTDGYRQAIRGIGQALQEAFDEDAFDCPDVK